MAKILSQRKRTVRKIPALLSRRRLVVHKSEPVFPTFRMIPDAAWQTFALLPYFLWSTVHCTSSFSCPYCTLVEYPSLSYKGGTSLLLVSPSRPFGNVQVRYILEDATLKFSQILPLSRPLNHKNLSRGLLPALESEQEAVPQRSDRLYSCGYGSLSRQISISLYHTAQDIRQRRSEREKGTKRRRRASKAFWLCGRLPIKGQRIVYDS